jgi:hypothetical protein
MPFFIYKDKDKDDKYTKNKIKSKDYKNKIIQKEFIAFSMKVYFIFEG